MYFYKLLCHIMIHFIPLIQFYKQNGQNKECLLKG